MLSGDNLSALTLMLAPGSATQPARYLLDVGVTGNWPVPSSALTVFTVESLGFHVDGTQSPPGVSLSGSVTFFASDPDLAFGLDVSAANSDPGGGWVITGQQNDSPVKVTDILTHYLPNNWPVSGLPEFEVTGFSAEIHVGSAALTPYYIISGTVDAFSNPILDGTIEATASFGNLLSTGGETGAVAARTAPRRTAPRRTASRRTVRPPCRSGTSARRSSGTASPWTSAMTTLQIRGRTRSPGKA